MTTTTWTLTLDAKPWSVNEQVRWHHQERAQRVREWRRAFGLLARQQRVPSLPAAVVQVRTTLALPHRLYDAGNDFYAAKAAVDGLVDALVLPGDGPDYVHRLVLHAPTRGTRTCMAVTVEARYPAPPPTPPPPVPLYDCAKDLADPASATLGATEAKALLNLLRIATLADPHHQRVAADLHQVLLDQGVRG